MHEHRWRITAESDCSATCGSGRRTRRVQCIKSISRRRTSVMVADANCLEQAKPAEVVECSNGEWEQAHWEYSSWTQVQLKNLFVCGCGFDKWSPMVFGVKKIIKNIDELADFTFTQNRFGTIISWRVKLFIWLHYALANGWLQQKNKFVYHITDIHNINCKSISVVLLYVARAL